MYRHSAQVTIKDSSIIQNDGLWIRENSQATIISCVIVGGHVGVLIDGSAQTIIKNSIISEKKVGIIIVENTWVRVEESLIVENNHGISILEPFTGYVAGKKNSAGRNDIDFSPDTLEILFTERGGELGSP